MSFEKELERLEKSFAVAAQREEQQRENEPKKENIENQLEMAKRQIEATLEARQYDRAGIMPEHWDFIIQLAAERIVKNYFGGKVPVGRFSSESAGFILTGKSRAGKTFLMRILADLRAIPTPIGESIIKNDYQAGGLDRVFSTYPSIRNRDFTLDDLGIIQDAKSFGNSGLIESILFERYEHWQNRGDCATFISSNLENYKEIEKVFGAQLANRIIDMCVMIPVDGENRGKRAELRFIRKEQ